MSKDDTEKDDDLRSEYDLAQLLKGGTRGKYAERFRAGTNLVLLEPDVASAFPTDEAVNAALRLAMRLAEIPQKDSVRGLSRWISIAWAKNPQIVA